jgi:hypothetical protein
MSKLDVETRANLGDPTPTLTLPLKGRETAIFLPLQGGGQKGDGVSVGAGKHWIPPYQVQGRP